MSEAQQPALVIPERLVLYDGVCGLCNKSVQFMLDRDPGGQLMYAPLQGDTAAALRLKYPEIPDHLSTLVFVERGEVHLYSEAVLRMSRHLSAPWRWSALFLVLPTAIRDVLYRLVANNRYRVWGKYDSCRIPAPGQIERFLP